MMTRNKTSSAYLHINTSAHLKIFLIGMMGSGKSYWAKRLSEKLDIPAYDLDHLVEIEEKKTIAEIFAEKGEAFFREIEADMLHTFKGKTNFILSCGGGTPCFSDNMKWMNKNGITIWLNEPVEVLTERLKAEKQSRPLIKNLAETDITGFLAGKLTEREPYYKLATYTLGENEISENALSEIISKHA